MGAFQVSRDRWWCLALVLALGSATVYQGVSPLDLASGAFAVGSIACAFQGRERAK